MPFAKEFKELANQYAVEFAHAVKAQPERRRKLMDIDGIIRYQLRVIEAVFVKGIILQDGEDGFPYTPDGRWPTLRRIFNEDLWLLLTPASKAVHIWGAAAISAASMTRKLYEIAEHFVIEMFNLHTQNGGYATITTEEEQLDWGPVPRVRITHGGGADTSVVFGSMAAVIHDYYSIPDGDFLAESRPEFGSLRHRLKSVDLSDIPEEDRNEIEDITKRLLETAGEVHAGRAVELKDVLLLSAAMTTSSTWTVAANRKGSPEPWPILSETISVMLREVEAAMRPTEIASWRLWDAVTEDALPAFGESDGAWAELFDFFKRKLSADHPVFAQDRQSTMDVRVADVLDHLPSHIREEAKAAASSRGGYQLNDFAKRAGVSESTLYSLRRELKCEMAERDDKHFLLKSEDALKILLHLISTKKETTKPGRKSRELLRLDYPLVAGRMSDPEI